MNKITGLIFLTTVAFINYSCFSNYFISDEEFNRKNPYEHVTVILKDSTEIKTLKHNIELNEKSIKIKREANSIEFPRSEVKMITAPKIDFVNSFLFLLGITGLSIMFLLIIVQNIRLG